MLSEIITEDREHLSLFNDMAGREQKKVNIPATWRRTGNETLILIKSDVNHTLQLLFVFVSL